MIVEDYVSLKQAKLLKEKGFDGICHSYYSDEFPRIDFEQDWNDWHNDTIISRPTHQMVLKWFKAKYRIYVQPVFVNCLAKNLFWACEIYNLANLDDIFVTSTNTFEKSEDAIDSAIDYILNNII